MKQLEEEETMDRTTADNTTYAPNEDLAEAIPSTLVNKLLGVILAEQREEILIKKQFQNFSYDPGTGMRRGDTLTTRVECESLTATKDEFEITLTGTVENQFGHQDSCRLYLYLIWDSTAMALSKHSCDGEKTFESKSLFIYSESSPRHLSDTVFELDFYRKSLSGSKQFLGQGRGYLVFGHNPEPEQ